MYSKVLVVLAFAALASANDVFLAASNNTEGHDQIFDQHIEAQWSITKQTKEVFVNTSDVICLINVTDLRAGKDGEASITSGGIGHHNVTISLSSPAVFRGYDFRVQVYAHTHEVDRDSRDVHHVPEVPESPENKTAEPDVTEIVSANDTEVTDLPTVATGTTEVTEFTTGKPEVTGVPSGKPVTVITDRVPEVPALEMGMHRVPKEVEQPPEMQAFVDFHPPRHG